MRPQTAAERVKALREHAGSHDKLAEALRALGWDGAVRQTIIRWEKAGSQGGGYPEGKNAEVLVAYANANDFDFTVADFSRPSAQEVRESLIATLERMQEEVREIRQRVEQLEGR